MYDQGVAEKIIQERTGHRSLEAHSVQMNINIKLSPLSFLLLVHLAVHLITIMILREKMNITRTVCQLRQPSTPSKFVSNLYINITQATPMQHKDNVITNLMNINIDKLFTSIEESYCNIGTAKNNYRSRRRLQLELKISQAGQRAPKSCN